MDVAQFRASFPEFADAPRYTDNAVTFWLSLAEKLISADRFDDLLPEAMAFFAAHNLVLSAGNKAAGASGALPGGAGGAVASKTVGSVSVSYDNASSAEPDAGHWNQTSYGRQYIRLARLVGHGCVQLC